MNTAVSTARNRVHSLEGGCNFRDIGGYAACDGRTVKWGQVYRTGVLTYFTTADHEPLKSLGVRAICDLRRNEERNKEPGRWPDTTAASLYWGDDENMPTVRSFAASRPRTPAGMRDSMIELYQKLPAWMAPRIRGFLDCVATGKLPVIVHCAAGKDRTGIAVAVLLNILGVAESTIMEDYLLTNEAGNFEEFVRARNSYLGVADAHQPLLSMPAEIRKVLYAADADYLNAALHTIETQHGGMDSYLDDVIGVNGAARERIREAMLE